MRLMLVAIMREGPFGKVTALLRLFLLPKSESNSIIGQIDDIENFGCVVTCPYHSYKIRLETGERIYKDLSHAFKIAGKRQRTHQVKVNIHYFNS